MERAFERRPDPEPGPGDDLIVPVGAREDAPDTIGAAPIGTPVEGASPAPIGTPVESVTDVPVAGAVLAKRPAPAPPPPWTRVGPAPRASDGVADGLTEDGALPPRPRRSYTPYLLVASLVLLACVLGAGTLVVREQRARERRELLALCERVPASAVRLAEQGGQVDWLLSDPEVAAALAAARARLAEEAAWAEAQRFFARLDAAETLEERLEVCDRTIKTIPAWADPRLVRAEVLLAMARRDVAAAMVADGGVTASFGEVAGAALREHDAARPFVSSEGDEQAAFLLRRARLCLSAPGDPAARTRAAGAAVQQARQLVGPRSEVEALAQAYDRALARDWFAVLDATNQALRADPDLVAAYLLRAEARLRVGEAAAAVADAQQALALEPRSVDAVALEVEARFLSVRPPTSSARALAIEELSRALGREPGHPRALAARAYATLTRDRTGVVTSPDAQRRAALQDASLALRLDPGQALAHAVIAEAAFAEGRRAEAIEAARRAVACAPDLADLHLLLGRLRARSGDLGALEDFDAAVRLRSFDARALTNQAALLLAKGDVARARRAADVAVAHDASLAEAYLQRGLAAYKASPRRLQEAVDDLSRAVSLDAGLADAHLYRACVLHDARMLTQALADLDRAEAARLERGAFHMSEVYLVRGHCLFGLKRWTEAEATYAEYLRRLGARPASPVAARRLARVRDLLAGRIDEAAIDVTKE